MAVATIKEKVLFCRADLKLAKSAQDIADRDYEGVISRVVRAAVRRFVEEDDLRSIETTSDTASAERAA